MATRVFDVVQDIPTDISGSLPNLAFQSLQYVNNWLRETTGSNSIDDSRLNVVTNLTAAITLSRMNNIGVDFSYNLGEFRVQKGKDTGNTAQMEFLLSLVNLELRRIPLTRATIVRVN